MPNDPIQTPLLQADRAEIGELQVGERDVLMGLPAGLTIITENPTMADLISAVMEIQQFMLENGLGQANARESS